MKAYRDMTDDEIKEATRQIVRDASIDDEIKQRLRDELGYPYSVAITSHNPTDQAGHDARVIVRGLGGLVRKDGAMVMIMMHGPRGNTISP